MAGNYLQPGNVMDYANPANAAPILSGDVVVFPSRIGVALLDIDADDTGSVQMTGVFSIPKKAAEALAQGVECFWSEDGVTATEGDVRAGVVWMTAEAAAATVAVKLVG